jgi:hypothetical protein
MNNPIVPLKPDGERTLSANAHLHACVTVGGIDLRSLDDQQLFAYGDALWRRMDTARQFAELADVSVIE